MKTTYPDGRVEEGGWVSFGMMQTAEGYNTIYVSKGIGADIEIPIPGGEGFSVFKIAFGYLNSQRLLLDKDTVLILDVGIDILQKGTGVTDTLLYGEKAVSGYADYLEENEVDVSMGVETVEEIEVEISEEE
jgi:hypothetical protein